MHKRLITVQSDVRYMAVKDRRGLLQRATEQEGRTDEPEGAGKTSLGGGGCVLNDERGFIR